MVLWHAFVTAFGFLRAITVAAGRHNLSLMAAGVAFFSMLALFPAIAALISLYGAFADPWQINQHLSLLEPVLPRDVFVMLSLQTGRLISARPGALGLASVVSLLLTLWSSRAGVTALISGLGVINRDQSRRGVLAELAVAYLLTLMLIGVAMLSILAVVVVPVIASFLPENTALPQIVRSSQWGISLAAVLIGVGALYRLGPARSRARPPWISVGSVAATAMWVSVSVAFSVYVGNFTRYNEVYGSLGAVVALLMWFYVSAFVVLLGAEINAELRKRRNRSRQQPDTAVAGPLRTET